MNKYLEVCPEVIEALGYQYNKSDTTESDLSPAVRRYYIQGEQ